MNKCVSSQKLAGNAEGAKRPTAGDEGCEFFAMDGIMSRSPGWARATTSHPEGARVPPFIEKLHKYLAFVIVLIFAASVITGCQEGSTSTTKTAGAAGTAKEAPEISAKAWLNSSPQSLAELKGKVTVVEFWATWCPPCRKSIPHLIEIGNKYKEKGVTIISLTQEAKDVVEPFAKQMGMNYPVGMESTSGQQYGVEGIPAAFVIGKDGKIHWSGHPMENLAAAIDEALK